MTLHDFPWINACLNGSSAVLLFAGWALIKFKQVRAHAYVMLSALGTSTAFLACYVTYHTIKAQRGELVTRFPESAWRRWYLGILLTHTVLAVVILPLIGMTLWYAYQRKWKSHHRLGMVTLPLWFYVSVTGVIIYWMLYHLAPTLRG